MTKAILENIMPVSAISPVSMTRYDSDFGGLAGELGAWFERYGFAIVADHGVPQAIIDDALAAAKAFFALPTAVKAGYHLTGGGGQRGYTAFGVETAKDHAVADLKEFWHTGRDLPEGHPYRDVMPPNVPVAEDIVARFDTTQRAMFESFDHLGAHILRAIAQYLDLPTDFFDAKIANGNSILRTLHYPAQQNGVAAGAIRAGAHTDINVITLLLGAEEPGLQLLDRAGNWLPVTAPPGCVAINIGDMLSRLTNDRLPSTIHRVVNPTAERATFARYSTPFFLHFAPDVLIESLPLGGPPKHTPITAHAFLQQRLREIKLA
jgi:isopenicillin N synthase-like dioxygenase